MFSYSWEGEDTLVRKLMLDVFRLEKGFYLDVGAHHPYNLSNTALLYSEGWRGINIDACPGSMAEFQEHRPNDVNLEVAIASTAGEMRFTQFDDPGLNGFLSDTEIERHKKRGVRVIGQTTLACREINEILNLYAKDVNIDLMSIDVEGMDEIILRQFDFSKWRPKAIITEVLGCHSVADVQDTPVHRLLRSKKYFLHSRLHFSCIYVDQAAYDYQRKSKNPRLNSRPPFLRRIKRKLFSL
jgi:FkbM family methyltransferase